MLHRACHRAPEAAPRGYGAGPRCRHGWGDRWGMPRKVLAGFCRWPGREHARPDPSFCAPGLRPADLLPDALGRPRPGVAIAAFASAAEADLGLLRGGVLPTRVRTRSAVSRSVN